MVSVIRLRHHRHFVDGFCRLRRSNAARPRCDVKEFLRLVQTSRIAFRVLRTDADHHVDADRDRWLGPRRLG